MLSRTPRLFALFIACMAVAACQPGKGLTKANVDQVTEGMAKKQVESILGLPTAVNIKDAALKKTTYVYAQSSGTVTITFREDKVESKETTLTE